MSSHALQDFGNDVDWDMEPPDNRRGARQIGLQALYWAACSTAGGAGSAAAVAAVAVEELSRRFALSAEVSQFAVELVQQVSVHRDELDELIAARATNWRQGRIARIDGIILRLALAEILYIGEIPVRVSIDEAIELAKLFSTEHSFGFVNGILDAIVHHKGLQV